MGQFAQQGVAQAGRREDARQANQAAALKQRALQMEQQAAQQQATQFQQDFQLQQQRLQEAVNARKSSEKQWWASHNLDEKAYKLNHLIRMHELNRQRHNLSIYGASNLEEMQTALSRLQANDEVLAIHRGIGNLASLVSNPVGPFSSDEQMMNYRGGINDAFVQTPAFTYPPMAAATGMFAPQKSFNIQNHFMRSLNDIAGAGDASIPGVANPQPMSDNAIAAAQMALGSLNRTGGAGQDALSRQASDAMVNTIIGALENQENTLVGGWLMELGAIGTGVMDATMGEIPEWEENNPVQQMMVGAPGAIMSQLAYQTEGVPSTGAYGDVDELLNALSFEDQQELIRSTAAALGQDSTEFGTLEQMAQYTSGVAIANQFLYNPVIGHLLEGKTQPGTFDDMGEHYQDLSEEFPDRVEIGSDSWYTGGQSSRMAQVLVDQLKGNALPEYMTEEQRNHAMKTVDAMYLGYLQHVSDPYLGRPDKKNEASAAYEKYRGEFARRFFYGEHAHIGRLVAATLSAQLQEVSELYGGEDRGLSSIVEDSPLYGELTWDEQRKLRKQVNQSDTLVSAHYKQMANLAADHVHTARSHELARLSMMAAETQHITGTYTRWQLAPTAQDAKGLLFETIEGIKQTAGDVQSKRFGAEDQDEFMDRHLIGIPSDIMADYIWNKAAGKAGLTGADYPALDIDDPEMIARLETSPWVGTLIRLAQELEPRRRSYQQERLRSVSALEGKIERAQQSQDFDLRSIDALIEGMEGLNE